MVLAAASAPGKPDEATRRERYRITYERMKLIGQACQQFDTDNNHFPITNSSTGLKTELSPDFLSSSFAWVDGWGGPFRYLSSTRVITRPGKPGTSQDCEDPDDPATCTTTTVQTTEVTQETHFALLSAGEDGKWEHERLEDYPDAWSRDYSDDLVIRDGEWVRRLPPTHAEWREAMADTHSKLWAIRTALSQNLTDELHLPAADSLPELIGKLSANLPPGFRADKDAWGGEFRFVHWTEPAPDSAAPPYDHYRIASSGADGKFARENLRLYQPAEFTTLDGDLVIEDGLFVSDFLDPGATALERSHRTMSKLRAVAMLVERHVTEHGNGYPTPSDIFDWIVHQPGPFISGIHPRLLGVDGWGRPIRYSWWNERASDHPGADHGCLASAGADGQFEFNDFRRYLAASNRPVESHGDDIVICDGQFVRQPAE